MSDRESREIVSDPHPEVVRWLDNQCPWPTDKPFPLTLLEARYIMQGYTVGPAARIILEDMLTLPGSPEGGDGGIMLGSPDSPVLTNAGWNFGWRACG